MEDNINNLGQEESHEDLKEEAAEKTVTSSPMSRQRKMRKAAKVIYVFHYSILNGDGEYASESCSNNECRAKAFCFEHGWGFKRIDDFKNMDLVVGNRDDLLDSVYSKHVSKILPRGQVSGTAICCNIFQRKRK